MIHIDVKTAFLNGNLQEEIYMRQPEGYDKGKGLVCKLLKSLYGLKQASRQWNLRFTQSLKEFELVALKSENCIFATSDCNLAGTKPYIVCGTYVDDGILMSNSKPLLDKLVKHLEATFEITKDDIRNFVGMQIVRKQNYIFIHQEMYIKKIISQFEMDNCKSLKIPMEDNINFSLMGESNVPSKPVDVPYQEALGSLLYAASGTRPDICYAANVLSRLS